VLGTNEIAPLTMATAFGGIAQCPRGRRSFTNYKPALPCGGLSSSSR